MELNVFTTPVHDPKRYVKCPCSNDAQLMSVEHLFGSDYDKRGEIFTVGSWHCDKCGVGYDITVNRSTGQVKMEKNKRTQVMVKFHVLLELDAKTEDKIYIVVADSYPNDWQSENFAYYYNEHTCPTNFLGRVNLIVEGDDFDPHGVFSYVRHVSQAEYDAMYEQLTVNECLARQSDIVEQAIVDLGLGRGLKQIVDNSLKRVNGVDRDEIYRNLFIELMHAADPVTDSKPH